MSIQTTFFSVAFLFGLGMLFHLNGVRMYYRFANGRQDEFDNYWIAVILQSTGGALAGLTWVRTV